MKIKNDFITNSSSSCFIVLVPKSFTIPSDELLQKIVDKALNSDWYKGTDDILSFENIKSEILINLECLKCGETIEDCINNIIYDVLDELLRTCKLSVGYVSIATSDYDKIVGIKEDDVIKVMLNNTNLSNLLIS